MATFDPAAHPGLVDLGPRLRDLSGDSAYSAGLSYLRQGAVREASVAGTTAYATVIGSTRYRVTVDFGEATLKPGCTCPAYRRNRFCKHVVAVCTALVERPQSFAVGEAPPPEVQAPKAKRAGATSTATGGTAGKAPRRGRSKAAAETGALRASGLETVDHLLADLADGGLLGLGAEKLTLLAGAADLVRGLKLRRLGNLLMALQRQSGAAPAGAAGAARPGRRGRANAAPAQEEDGFARLLSDLYLTRQATAVYLGAGEGEGEADGAAGGARPDGLDAQAAEDLVGKTWRDEELEPVAGLELMELAYERQDDGEFRVETSYLGGVDGRGGLYLETQISPSRLSSAQPKPRHRFRLLVEDGALYPGQAPRRLKLRRVRRAPLRAEDVSRLVAGAPDTVGELRRRLMARLATPFGDPAVPVLFRPAALLTSGPHSSLAAADGAGELLPLSWPEDWTGALPELLPTGGEYALFGRLRLEPQGPRLACLALVGPALRWLSGPVFPEVPA
jgi:hypothetical protein